MAEVTVKQLAADVGAPVDRLLKQIVEAGLKARSENDAVTSDEKQQLLAYLRKTMARRKLNRGRLHSSARPRRRLRPARPRLST